MSLLVANAVTLEKVISEVNYQRLVKKRNLKTFKVIQHNFKVETDVSLSHTPPSPTSSSQHVRVVVTNVAKTAGSLSVSLGA